jgi:tRNA-specific 2-thiouridylase
MNRRVLLGMSGGIDSTVTAILLQKAGYEVVGLYMKLHSGEKYHRENFTKVKRVGKYLNIEIHLCDLLKEFQDEVYNYFVNSYIAGVTPNPCIVCNRAIKFGKMVEFANSLGIEKVSTGHYLKCDGEFFYKARDRDKDQSYFVAQVKKEVLPRLIFPLGDWIKDDVKEFAKSIPSLQDIGEQKESSEICFVESSYIDVLKKHIDINKIGETLNSKGEVVGTHKGYMHYTIGKRRGFRVEGAHEPHFVLAIEPKNNRIVVGKRDELKVNRFNITEINLFKKLKKFKATVKIRYRTKAVPCRVKIESNIGFVELDEEIFGLAYGQIAVFYHNDMVIASGVICEPPP